MSELVVYGASMPQPVRSVLYFLQISNIEYTFRPVNISAGEHLTEEYSKINPFQTLPAIVHNGFNLWESAAIVTYLSEVYNVDNEMYPKDLKTRARINAYLHWHHENMRTPLASYFFSKHISPKVANTPALTDLTEKPYKQALEIWYTTIENQLKETGFIARTPEKTIADIFAFNEVSIGLLIPLDLTSHPIIQQWYTSMSSDAILQSLLSDALTIANTFITPN